MTPNFLQKIITAHYIWLNSKGDSGQRANFRWVNLRNVDLRHANLSGADLRYANLREANLSYADLSNADFRDADLRSADLQNANLDYTNLGCTNLRFADLSNANLEGANLRGTNLSCTDLNGVDLHDVDLSLANLAEVKGLLKPTDWMDSNFQKNKRGYIVFKRIGMDKTQYPLPDYWVIEEGSYLTEIVDGDRKRDCSHGINFGTREWCRSHYPRADLWECLLEFGDLNELVVPYGTDGKARCSRLKLLRRI